MLGQQLADWLTQRVDPSRIYDHNILAELAPYGIDYDPSAFMLSMSTGELTVMPTYSPAELMRHPVVEVTNIEDAIDTRWMLGYEIADTLHRMVWPSELPPGQPKNSGWKRAFAVNVASIAQRDGVSYRNDPPGGWWHETPTRRRR